MSKGNTSSKQRNVSFWSNGAWWSEILTSRMQMKHFHSVAPGSNTVRCTFGGIPWRTQFGSPGCCRHTLYRGRWTRRPSSGPIGSPEQSWCDAARATWAWWAGPSLLPLCFTGSWSLQFLQIWGVSIFFLINCTCEQYNSTYSSLSSVQNGLQKTLIPKLYLRYG